MRIAGGLLAVATLAGATACAASDQPAPGTTPTAATAPPPATASQPPTETLTPLLQQALPNVQGKTFTSVIVTFPPGARAASHRHGDAFVYAYVLEGTVRSQLEGQPVTTFRQGQNWIEPPGAHHVLTENTSSTAQAKLLVAFVADPGAQLKVDDPHS
ncbi:cupin domain-containing protein [Amycolatopsis sp. FDAARGOS 1241]|uniref:cupin domain-containing protein n=1 Tax=Amycolatopsis sp. FDAARGOS 1241 TaxID=2778070 RepID=UPI00194F0A56|nr:cupin domain-containing protein [Amycolatopsis sp. FDAARGOS 1241]QRP42640.1 cupin domain-containing protein [Amycolatopsis sp. FDAARGOS 1241]